MSETIEFPIGKAGYIADLLATELPMGAVSDISNIRFHDGAAHASPMGKELFTAASGTPEGICSFQTGRGYGRQLCVPCNDGNIYLYGTDDGLQKTVFTGATSIGVGGVTKWSWHTGPAMIIGMHRNQSPLILLDPESWWYGTPGSPTFSALPWDVTAGTTWTTESVKAVFFRNFENQLLAFNTREAGQDYQARVRWSSLYSPGAAPETWDESRTDHIAGYFDIVDTEGAIWDARRLGNMLAVYKADGVWSGVRTGGDDVFDFTPLPIDVRALITDCVVPFSGKHFVLARDDVVVHDGVNVDYVASGQVVSRIFGNLNDDQLNRVHCFHVPVKKEIWVCYPTGSSTVANEASVWNYKTGRWSHREIPGAMQLDLFRFALRSPTAQDAAFKKWAEYPAAASSDGKVWELDTVTDNNGAAPTCYMERRGISFFDRNTHAFVRRVTIPMRNRVPVTVKVGHHNSVDGTITWDATRTYDPNPNGNEDVEVTVRAGGRYIALRIESAATASYSALDATLGGSALWSVNTAFFDVVPIGNRGKT